MTPELPHPDELLSASHDGELSETERAAVERLLAESPAAREMLDDFRELSTLLQSLPRPLAPATLCRSVLLRLETSRSSAPPAPLPRRRSWLRWGASLVAAALLVAVGTWLGRRGEHPELADGRGLFERDVVIATNGTAPAPAEVSGSPGREGLAVDRFWGDSSIAATRLRQEAQTESVPASEPSLSSGAVDAPAAIPPSPPREEREGRRGAVGDATSRALSFEERAAARLVIDPQSPPSVADLLAYVDRVADQTVIVEMEVVDVDRTAEDMLVLLRRRGVQVVGEIPAEAVAQAVREAAEAEPMLVGVYVEATDQQLAAVVDELTTQVAINEAATRRAELAQTPLDDRLQKIERDYGSQRQSRKLGDGALAPPTGGAGELERRRQMAISQTPQSLSLPSVGNLAAGAAPAATPAGKEPLPAPTEWGVKMNLSESLYRQLDRQAELGDRELTQDEMQPLPRPPSPVPAILGQASLAARHGGGAPAGDVRRVLFVFQRPKPE